MILQINVLQKVYNVVFICLTKINNVTLKDFLRARVIGDSTNGDSYQGFP